MGKIVCRVLSHVYTLCICIGPRWTLTNGKCINLFVSCTRKSTTNIFSFVEKKPPSRCELGGFLGGGWGVDYPPDFFWEFMFNSAEM